MPGPTLSDAISGVRDRIRDLSTEKEVTDAEITTHISQAIKRYSKDRPQRKVHEITGDGSTYEWSLPSDWEDDFSTIIGGCNQKVEYPAGEREPEYVDDDEWEIYDLVSPAKFRIKTLTPGSSEKVRFAYTVRHTLDGTSTTIPTADFDAVVCLAAGYALEALAAKFGRASDTTLGADAVNYRDSQLKCKQEAEAWRGFYFSHLGVKEDETPAASATAEWDQSPSWPTSYGTALIHSRRRR